jgi:4-hydroxy-3-methylbut-2-enyl diphosphate reductase
VLSGVRERGLGMTAVNVRQALPQTDTVLITANGISDRERGRLQTAGKKLLDTTCPLVARAHQAARQLQRDGYHVLLIGKRGHVEVQGIVEDLAEFDVVQNADEVKRYPSRRLGIMCQTTTPVALAREIREAVARLNPEAEIRFLDTICQPTKEHQRALERLLDQVDAVVVVGGRNSNNTRELAARCRARGRAAFHVQSASELDPGWFNGVNVVGLTAGTSTLDASIQEVKEALLRF